MGKPRILCINPWIYDFTAYDLWSKPLGLLYIAAFLREKGLTVEYIDCLDRWHPELLKSGQPKIRKYGIGPFYRQVVPTPSIVGFIPRRFTRYGLPEDIFRQDLINRPRPDAILVTTFMTYWYLGPKRVVEICREIFPGVPILLGGIYATLMPEHARKVIRPDYLIQGPGEIQVSQLLSDLIGMPQLKQNMPTNIDDFPYPAFDLQRKLDYLIILTSRGCPFRCTFCATYHLENAFTQRSPDHVVKEILQQTYRFCVRDVAFYDDALLMKADQHIKPILLQLKKSKRFIRFHTPNGLHGRYIDEELARLMYDCNFKTIRLSLESVAKERRRDIQNKITPDEMKRAVQNLVKAGFEARELETYIIMGLPDQSLEEVMETILYANSLGVQIRLASFSPIPGTVDYQRAIEQNLLPEDADPLLTNKTVIPLFRSREAYDRFHTITQFTHMLNEGVKRGVTLFKPVEFRRVLLKALDRFKEDKLSTSRHTDQDTVMPPSTDNILAL